MKSAPQYLQLNKGGSRARMSILRMQAIEFNKPRPPSMAITWRGARAWGFHNWHSAYAALSQGSNSGQQIWYCHTGPEFRNERYCDEINGARIDHTGWFCDIHQDETARGIVACLPHGRFIAGYRLSANDERVYFDKVHTDEIEAARMADAHAHVIGETELAYNARWNEARELEDEIETETVRLRECITLRNKNCFEYVRDEIADLVQSIRNNREKLSADYADVTL